MTRLNNQNRCATIDEVIKPSFLKQLLEAMERVIKQGFGEITIIIEHGKPRHIKSSTSETVKHETE